LDELKLSSETIVLFTSDHGYNLGRHTISTKGNGHWLAGGVNGPKRPNMWDTSIRVPLAIRWPGVVPPDTRIDAGVSNLDMFRTVLGMLQLKTPDGMSVRGRDFSPLLRGESLPEQDVLFGQYDLHNRGLAYLRMVRTPRYKYVRHFHENRMDELYDLQADPGESRNLLQGRRRDRETWDAVADDLRRQLTAWQESIDDPLLKDRY
ncbi:MAG: sulfatase family protein, partial [Planctomycetaceae bacterium]